MDPSIEEYERAFRRAGLPRFIQDYTAWDDVYTRASPWLVVILVLELAVALNLDWPMWANILIVAVGLVIIFGGLLLLSRWRAGRWSLLPSRVGRAELVFFVLAPAVLPLLAGGQWRSALATVGANLTALVLIYVVVAYGVVPTAWATFTRAAGELAASAGRLVRVLPVLLVFSVVLFINTEMWQVFASLTGSVLAILTVFFAAVITSLVSIRLAQLVRDLETSVAQGDADRAPVAGPALTRRERGNVRTLMMVSQLTQVAGVSLGMGLFFCIFGVLVIGQPVLESWVGTGASWHVDLTIGHTSLTFTNIHLRGAFAIACLTGLYYAVTVQADQEYRREFLAGMADELAPTFAMRASYLATLAAR